MLLRDAIARYSCNGSELCVLTFASVNKFASWDGIKARTGNSIMSSRKYFTSVRVKASYNEYSRMDFLKCVESMVVS